MNASDPSDPSQLELLIITEDDIVRARTRGRDFCRSLGFSEINQVKVATAISELARNIFHYAKTGEIILRKLTTPKAGLEIVARDRGPGIPDVKLVLSGTYKSKTGMGKGLLGTRYLMDYFDVVTAPHRGTTVTLRKFTGTR